MYHTQMNIIVIGKVIRCDMKHFVSNWASNWYSISVIYHFD